MVARYLCSRQEGQEKVNLQFHPVLALIFAAKARARTVRSVWWSQRPLSPPSTACTAPAVTLHNRFSFPFSPIPVQTDLVPPRSLLSHRLLAGGAAQARIFYP